MPARPRLDVILAKVRIPDPVCSHFKVHFRAYQNFSDPGRQLTDFDNLSAKDPLSSVCDQQVRVKISFFDEQFVTPAQGVQVSVVCDNAGDCFH